MTYFTCCAFDPPFAPPVQLGPEVLLSLHLKATMMKVSDPIMFGHAVKVYYKAVWEKHGALLDELGVNANNGVGDLYAKLKGHPMQAEVEADVMKVGTQRREAALA